MYPDAEDLRWESWETFKYNSNSALLDDSPKLKGKEEASTHEHRIQLLPDVLHFNSESRRLGKLIQSRSGGRVWVGRVLIALVVHRGRPAGRRPAGRRCRFGVVHLQLRHCVSEHRTVLARRLWSSGQKIWEKLRGVNVTFAIVLVHVHRLAQAEGAESHHVFVRVEGDTVERCGVAELRVDRHLVTWGGPNGREQSETLGKQSSCSLNTWILTRVCVPNVRHPVFAARKDKVPTRCEGAVDSLSVVGGASVLLYHQAGKKHQ